MWVVTTQGFYSVVQHRDVPTDVLVRARCEDDIRSLAELIPAGEVIGPLADADYRWRMRCTASEWIEALTCMSSAIDYDNFKDAVKRHQGRDRASVYMGVWSRLLSLDDRPKVKFARGGVIRAGALSALPLWSDETDLGRRVEDCRECGEAMYEGDAGVCAYCGWERRRRRLGWRR